MAGQMIQGQKENFQKELDEIIEENVQAGKVQELLLHSCCAPCSSYVFEYLSQYFRITDYFYNPNITDEQEYRKRTLEIRRLIQEQPHRYEIRFVEGAYDRERFFLAAKGLEACPERGERCAACFRLRLRETAKAAALGIPDENGKRIYFDYITTTLTISPLKDARLLNRIGREAAREFGVRWLPCDFKKRGGFQRSLELSRRYHLYRQNYCGCIFSKRAQETGS